MTLKITISTNQSVVDKKPTANDWNSQFVTQHLTPTGIQREIQAGHAIAASFKQNTRKKENFQATGFVGLDFDGGFSITKAMQDPFIHDYAFLLYTTASHLADGKTERFRVLWALPEDLTDRSGVEAVLKGLLKKYPMADKACKDASRMFYGNTQAQFHLAQEVTLPALIVDELKNADLEPLKQPVDQSSRRQTSQKSVQSSPASQHDIEEVKRALSYIPQRKPGSGNYQTSGVPPGNRTNLTRDEGSPPALSWKARPTL